MTDPRPQIDAARAPQPDPRCQSPSRRTRDAGFPKHFDAGIAKARCQLLPIEDANKMSAVGQGVCRARLGNVAAGKTLSCGGLRLFERLKSQQRHAGSTSPLHASMLLQRPKPRPSRTRQSPAGTSLGGPPGLAGPILGSMCVTLSTMHPVAYAPGRKARHEAGSCCPDGDLSGWVMCGSERRMSLL